MRVALIALALAVPRWSSAASPYGPEPENAGFDATCAVRAMQIGVRVPISPPALAHVPENMNRIVQDGVRAARKGLSSARRSLDRIELSMDRVISATNECGGGLEDAFSTLRSTAEAAVRLETVPDVERYAGWGWKIDWDVEPTAKVAAEASPDAARGRYAAACRASDIDAELYAPSSPELPATAREKLAAIAVSAAAVEAALRDQKRAFDELLPLAGGRDCREMLSAFDRLVADERGAYFAYRRKAVAAAVWDGLSWEKIAAPR